MISSFLTGVYELLRLPASVAVIVLGYFMKRVFKLKTSDYETIWTSFFYYCCNSSTKVKVHEEDGTYRIKFNWQNIPLSLLVRKNKSSDIFVFFQIFIREEYEPFFEKLTTLRPCEICLDAGANVGYFSVACASRFPEIKVFALEPDPENFNMIEKNIALNSLQNRVTPFKLALWTTDTNLYLIKNGLEAWAIRVSENENTETTCSGASISSIATRVGVDFFHAVKLDVEGAEHVLFSHADFVNHISHATLIGLEIHGKSNAIKEVLKNLNYTIEQYNELTLATKINQ